MHPDSNSKQALKSTQESRWLAGLGARFPAIRSETGEVYLVHGGEAIDLRGGRARSALALNFLTKHGRRPPKALVDAATQLLAELAAKAPPQEVPLRVGAVREGPGFDLARGDQLVIDLLRPEGFAVLDSRGVRIQPGSPVPFRRAGGMLPLPMPELDCTASLRELLGLVWPSGMQDAQKLLPVCFLLSAVLPGMPKPHLLLTGPQGSGKSFLAQLLRGCIDPHVNSVLRPPGDSRELFVCLHNHFLPAFDNLSRLKEGLADDLCGLSSGAGFTARRLYTDSELVQFAGSRGVIMTAIYSPSLRPDLLDRVLWVELEELQRRESYLQLQEFITQLGPLLLGALLRTLSVALNWWNRSECTPENPIRLIDAHQLLLAATQSPHFGWSRAEVEAALQSNRARLLELQREASPVLALFVDIAAQRFEGTYTQLLERLGALAPKLQSRRGEIPRSPEELGRALKDLEPELRAAGVVIERKRGGGKGNPRIIVLRMSNADQNRSRKAISLNPATFEDGE